MKTKYQKMLEEEYLSQGWDKETAEEMAHEECASRAGDYPEEDDYWWGAF